MTDSPQSPQSPAVQAVGRDEPRRSIATRGGTRTHRMTTVSGMEGAVLTSTSSPKSETPSPNASAEMTNSSGGGGLPRRKSNTPTPVLTSQQSQSALIPAALGRCSIAEAEAKVQRQAPFLVSDPANRIASSQRLGGFDYLLSQQDHTAVAKLRTTLFPALAHSIEAVLAAAVEDAVRREMEEAINAVPKNNSRTASPSATPSAFASHAERVEAARIDYVDRATACSIPSKHPDAKAMQGFSSVPMRARPVLPLGQMQEARIGGKHPIILLAEELKKRAGGKDSAFDRPPTPPSDATVGDIENASALESQRSSVVGGTAGMRPSSAGGTFSSGSSSFAASPPPAAVLAATATASGPNNRGGGLTSGRPLSPKAKPTTSFRM